MKSLALRCKFPLIVCLGILSIPTLALADKDQSLPARASTAAGLSHVRVVRLSYISGAVSVKRPGSTEWAKALVNTPLQEGFEISTSENSYAEVEFENGSTARLGELSKLNFDQLAVDAEGNKLNVLTFEKGYATFHLIPEHHDSYTVKISKTTVTPNGKTLFRADLGEHRGRVEVFSGSVQMATAANSEKLTKNKVVEFDPEAALVAFDIKTGIVKDSWDGWTDKRDTQAQLALSSQSLSYGNSMYGFSDLDAYGEWAFFPGFGYGWSPFVGMGWEPFGLGMWSWYPSFGYTWISAEPWGWLPYHYGNWSYNPGFGWFWMPTGSTAFSAAPVNWYSGPGWVGWTPRGTRGPGAQGRMTTAPTIALQNGQYIGPNNVIHMPVTAGTAIKQVPFAPGAGAMLSGLRGKEAPQGAVGMRAATMQRTAPPSILMGGNAATEGSLRGGHHEPLRARMGTTLGGQYRVGGTVGEFRGDAFKGTGGPNAVAGPQGQSPAAAPVFVSRGQGGAGSAPMGGNSAPSVGAGGSSRGGGMGGNSMGGGGMSHGGGMGGGGTSMGGASAGGNTPAGRGH